MCKAEATQRSNEADVIFSSSQIGGSSKDDATLASRGLMSWFNDLWNLEYMAKGFGAAIGVGAFGGLITASIYNDKRLGDVGTKLDGQIAEELRKKEGGGREKASRGGGEAQVDRGELQARPE